MLFLETAIGNDSTIIPIIGAVMLYNGSSAAFNETFSEFLSIPTIAGSLGPLSYLDISQVIPDIATGGEIFGASVLAGIPASLESSNSPAAGTTNPYLETFRLFNNFTASVAASNQIFGITLAFTPILENQIRVGLERGGNAIDPPLGNGGFNAVQFAVNFLEGLTDIPPEIEQARDFFFET